MNELKELKELKGVKMMIEQEQDGRMSCSVVPG